MAGIRDIVYLRNYFLDFYEAQIPAVQKKIDWTLDVIREFRIVPEQYLDSMEGYPGMFNVRVAFGGRIFRAFCLFDEGNLVVLLHGFEKKTQTTPRRELDRALRIQREYYDAKKTGEIANHLRRAPR